MLPDHDWDILARYIAGETPASERAAVERWLGEDRARAGAAAELQRIWDSRSKRVDVDAAWLTFKARTTPNFTFAHAAASPGRSGWLKAAIMAGLLVVGALTARALLLERSNDD